MDVHHGYCLLGRDFWGTYFDVIGAEVVFGGPALLNRSLLLPLSSFSELELLNILSAYKEVLTYYEGWLSTSHLPLVTPRLGSCDTHMSAVSAATWMWLLLCLAWLVEYWMA